jgi:hypothetical protein
VTFDKIIISWYIMGYFTGPLIFDDFVNSLKEVVRGRIFWGMGVGEPPVR